MEGPGAAETGRRETGRGLRPSLLGLAGDSASGKSTLSRGIEYILGTDRVGRISTDDYHRFDRRERGQRERDAA